MIRIIYPGAILNGSETLTHWGRVTHICLSKLTIIGSDNGLSPSRRQAIIWTNAEILLIRPSGTNLSEILIEIDVFTFKKVHLKMSSAKCRPFCLGLNVLNRKEIGLIILDLGYVPWAVLFRAYTKQHCLIAGTPLGNKQKCRETTSRFIESIPFVT